MQVFINDLSNGGISVEIVAWPSKSRQNIHDYKEENRDSPCGEVEA